MDCVYKGWDRNHNRFRSHFDIKQGYRPAKIFANATAPFILSSSILHAIIIAVIENQARQYTVPDLCSRFQFRNTPVRFRRSGNMTSQIYSQTGALSDCKPAVFNGKATWYASNPLTAKTDGIITYATPFIVFRVKPGKLSTIQKIQPTPIKSQAPQPNTVSVHTASQTVKKYTDLIHL